MDLETFSIDIYDQPPHAIVLRLAGEFDIVSEPALQEALDSLCHRARASRCWWTFPRHSSWGSEVSDASSLPAGDSPRPSFAHRSPIVEKVLRILGIH